MLETVLQPATKGSSEIQTVTPRLQTLGLMKPTSIIPKNEAKRKANRNQGHAGWCLISPVISRKLSTKSRSLPLKQTFGMLVQKGNMIANVQRPENSHLGSLLWMFPPSYRSQKDFGSFVGPAVCSSGLSMDYMYTDKKKGHTLTPRPSPSTTVKMLTSSSETPSLPEKKTLHSSPSS